MHVACHKIETHLVMFLPCLSTMISHEQKMQKKQEQTKMAKGTRSMNMQISCDFSRSKQAATKSLWRGVQKQGNLDLAVQFRPSLPKSLRFKGYVSPKLENLWKAVHSSEREFEQPSWFIFSLLSLQIVISFSNGMFNGSTRLSILLTNLINIYIKI